MTWTIDGDALRGKIAVGAGATRGAGRGIASALGEAGATVICTGRSTRARGSSRSDYDREETIDENAELVNALGGTGIAIEADHLDPGEVTALADQIRRDYGHIDVLVNDIGGAEVLKGGPSEWDKPIWEHDLDSGLRILRLAIDTHLITSHRLLPLLIGRPGGLVVEVTDGTAAYNRARYRISVFYDLAKTAVNRLAFSQGHDLAPFDATAIAVTPGWLRSEMMLEAFGVTEANWRESFAPITAGAQPTAPPGFTVADLRATSGAPLPRWRSTHGALVGTSSRSPRPTSRTSTGSPTSTVRGPMCGGSRRRPTRGTILAPPTSGERAPLGGPTRHPRAPRECSCVRAGSTR